MQFRLNFCITMMLISRTVSSCGPKHGHQYSSGGVDFSNLDHLDASKHPTLGEKIKQVVKEHYHYSGRHPPAPPLNYIISPVHPTTQYITGGIHGGSGSGFHSGSTGGDFGVHQGSGGGGFRVHQGSGGGGFVGVHQGTSWVNYAGHGSNSGEGNIVHHHDYPSTKYEYAAHNVNQPIIHGHSPHSHHQYRPSNTKNVNEDEEFRNFLAGYGL